MRLSHVLTVLVLLLCLSPMVGCGGSSGPATGPDADELSEFLTDNPDIANEPEEPEEEEEE